MKKIILALFVLSIALIGVSCVSAASDVDIENVHSDSGVSIDHSNFNGPSTSLDEPLGPYRPYHPWGPLIPRPSDPFNPWGPSNPSNPNVAVA